MGLGGSANSGPTSGQPFHAQLKTIYCVKTQALKDSTGKPKAALPLWCKEVTSIPELSEEPPSNSAGNAACSISNTLYSVEISQVQYALSIIRYWALRQIRRQDILVSSPIVSYTMDTLEKRLRYLRSIDESHNLSIFPRAKRRIVEIIDFSSAQFHRSSYSLVSLPTYMLASGVFPPPGPSRLIRQSALSRIGNCPVMSCISSLSSSESCMGSRFPCPDHHLFISICNGSALGYMSSS